MTHYGKQKAKVSEATQAEALKIAKGIQRPGQTKEQTKLISQGIQKGIDQYKKQHKAKSRALNKQLKKHKQTPEDAGQQALPVAAEVKQHWLPWTLLGISWLVFLVYIQTAS